MNPPNHSDLNRALGRMEGNQDAMGARLDRLEQIIEAGFAELRKEIAELKATENQRKGVIATLMVLSGAIGGLVAKFGAFIFGGGHS